MCLNDCCFSFQKFSKSKVAVFISGPGNLEFPWALETALRLKNTGAQVTVFDVSDYSLAYSARIKVLGKQLPIKTRKILRGSLLKQNTRIENRISNICSSNDIPYFTSKSSKTLNKHYSRKLVKISDFKDETIATYGLKYAAEESGCKSCYLFSVKTIDGKFIGTLGLDFTKRKTALDIESINRLLVHATSIGGVLMGHLNNH
jgi:hypothetical protein